MADNNLFYKSAGIGSLLNVSTGQTYLPAFGVVTATGATNLLNATSFGATGTVLVGGGASAMPSFQSLQGNTTVFKVPTVQRFTSGSGAYNPPSNPSPLFLIIEMVGGGGGAAGTSAAGASGTATTFGGILTCSPGTGGLESGSFGGGAGGTATITAPAVTIFSVPGGSGGGSFNGSLSSPGGMGGNSAFGGAGGSGADGGGAGQPAGLNSGSGGGGDGGGVATQPCSGGGAGGACKVMLPTPGASYAYAVGSAGAAGNSHTGNGAAGFITVTEHYQ